MHVKLEALSGENLKRTIANNHALGNEYVNMQLDVGNCLSGGGDPIALLKEFPGRTRTIHIKEHEEHYLRQRTVQGGLPAVRDHSATRWYIVEMGSEDGIGFDVPRQALAKLRRLGKPS